MIHRHPFIFFLLFWLLVLETPVKAQTMTSVSPAEYKEITETYQTCQSRPQSAYYKCDCVAVVYHDKMKEALTKANDANRQINRAEQINLLEKSYTQCANLNSVAVHAYNRCVDWAVMARDDFKEFCSCFAVKQADHFQDKKPLVATDPANKKAKMISECEQELRQNKAPSLPVSKK